MFCSECGKTIDDEALICSECGAITKKGMIKLQEAAKQGEKAGEYEIFTMIKPKDNTKTLRLVAMILGLVGSVLLLSSLLVEFGSATVPIIGKYGVSVSNYLDKKTIFVVILAIFSVVSSLLKYSVLEIITGAITGGWIGYLMWEIQNRASTSEVSGLVDINFGLGTYLFICAALMMITSGIVYIVAAKKSKENTPVEKKVKPRNKKTDIIVGSCLGVLLVGGIIGFVLFTGSMVTKEAESTVNNFMNAALHYEVNSMKGYLAADVNDKNGFMEAYTPYTMRNAFLSVFGVQYDELKDDQKKAIDRTGTLFGENYLKEFNIAKATKNSDGSFTVKVKASIIDMSTTSEQIQKESAAALTAFEKKDPEMAEFFRYFYPADEVVKNMVLYIFDDICPVIDNAIKNAGSMETEFTFVVKKIDGNYKITEIDYKDE